MGLLENLNREPRPNGKKPCRTARLLEDLEPAERDKVTEILASIVANEGRYTSSWLTRQLNSAGHVINHQTLLRHARQECCCGS